jgi:predicted nucleic acid-binding protein
MDKKESSILIDTDVLINFFDTKKLLYQVANTAFENFKKDKIDPVISVIVIIEMLQGNKTSSEKNRIAKQLIHFQEIAISDSIGLIAKDLIITYSASHGLMLGDAMIAATALYFDIPLFTFNKKDFRFIKTLKLYEPL